MMNTTKSISRLTFKVVYTFQIVIMNTHLNVNIQPFVVVYTFQIVIMNTWLLHVFLGHQSCIYLSNCDDEHRNWCTNY